MAIDHRRIESLIETELRAFAAARSRSRALFEAARAHVHGGVPLHWMRQ